MKTDFCEKWESVGATFSASIRVAADHKLNLFLGYSQGKQRMLILKSKQKVFRSEDLPIFENIGLLLEDALEGQELSLTLNQSSLKDLFSSISWDLVEASSRAETEVGAAQIFVSRLKRWSELLEDRHNKGLSFIQQLGLIGELYLLEWLLSDQGVSPETAIYGWRGPDGDARDISLGSLSIEVKSTLATSKNVIKVSSLDQLDAEGGTLVISRLSFSKSDEGLCFSELIDSIQKKLDKTRAKNDFWRKLFLIGYDPEADYTKNKFQLIKHSLYIVDEDFPKLTPEMVPAGIRSAQYEIDMEGLNQYLLDNKTFKDLVHGTA
jgi:hypothetical protein